MQSKESKRTEKSLKRQKHRMIGAKGKGQGGHSNLGKMNAAADALRIDYKKGSTAGGKMVTTGE